MADEIVVFVTAGDVEEAKKIANHLVKTNLAACANVLPSVISIFQWQGDICEENECLLIIKTVKSRISELIDAVKELHSYDVPEIITLPIVSGSEDYLQWVREETRLT